MQLSKIDASLSHGVFYVGIKLLWFYIAFFVYFPISAGATIFLIVSEWFYVVAPMALVGVISLLLCIAIVFIIIENGKLKKKIVLWLEDAVEVKANSRKIEQNGLGKKTRTKIQVAFIFTGQDYTKTGGNLGLLGGRRYICSKYTDREIDILYSPKFDEVLILKDTKDEMNELTD